MVPEIAQFELLHTILLRQLFSESPLPFFLVFFLVWRLRLAGSFQNTSVLFFAEGKGLFCGSIFIQAPSLEPLSPGTTSSNFGVPFNVSAALSVVM